GDNPHPLKSMAEARLEVTDTLGRRVVPLDKPKFTIGRRSANDLQLAGTDVSRDHAEIHSADGQFILRDRASRCGTYVNGAQVEERRLTHGDKIRIGRMGGAELVFLLHERSGDTVSHASSGGTAIVGGFRQIATLLDALGALGGNRDLADVHMGTIALGIRHVLCVPLRLVRYVDNPGMPVESRSIGVLYLDSREKGTLLAQAARTALETLAAEAAVAIENARLFREAI